MKKTYSIPNEMPRALKSEYQPDDGQYAFVSWKWVVPFAMWIGSRNCLEVMAGRGILSSALRQLDKHVIATDDFSWNLTETATDIEPMDALFAIRRYGKKTDVLIMSWPPTTDIAYHALRVFHEVNPDGLVVYVGETVGGDMASELFFQHFELVLDPLFQKVANAYETRFGYYDKPMLGRYTTSRVK